MLGIVDPELYDLVFNRLKEIDLAVVTSRMESISIVEQAVPSSRPL